MHRGNVREIKHYNVAEGGIIGPVAFGQQTETTDEGQSEKDKEQWKSKTRRRIEMSRKKLRKSPNHEGGLQRRGGGLKSIILKRRTATLDL